jgi:hypothetical protein
LLNAGKLRMMMRAEFGCRIKVEKTVWRRLRVAPETEK